MANSLCFFFLKFDKRRNQRGSSHAGEEKKNKFQTHAPPTTTRPTKTNDKSAKECDAFLFFISSSLCLVFRGLSSHQSDEEKRNFLIFAFENTRLKSHAREMIQSPPTLLRAPRTFAKLYEEKRRDKTHPRRRWTTLLSFLGHHRRVCFV